MRLHEDLNGYVVVTTPRGAAQGQWAFADRDGHRYFIKMFLSPKYPRPSSAGSDEMKEKKRAACAAFENRHQAIRRAVPSYAEGGGNLVVTTDFFRVDSTYYKVTDMVHAVDLPPLYELEPRQTLTILRTLFFSLRLLHGARIVHSDLKPENVLFQETTPGVYVAKVIDFDEAYISGKPPERGEVVGDQRFYSPELLCYITGDVSVTARSLTTSSDIFSLGLFLHHAIVGSMPGFDRDEYQFACEAVVAGQPLEVFGLSGPLEQLVISMLQLDPKSRPGIQAVIDLFSEFDPGSFQTMMTHAARHRVGPSTAGASPPVARPTGEASSTGGGLKSTVRKTPIALGAGSVAPTTAAPHLICSTPAGWTPDAEEGTAVEPTNHRSPPPIQKGYAATPDEPWDDTPAPTPIPVPSIEVDREGTDERTASMNKLPDPDSPLLLLGDGEGSPSVEDGRAEAGTGPAEPTGSGGTEAVTTSTAILTESGPRASKLKSTVRPK
jgi:eukaryotic-like serine/threonine-protein kinase